MGKSANLAVVGATGAVGTAMLSILEEREFPLNHLYAVASERSKDKTLSFRSQPLAVHCLADFDFSQVDIALFSAGSSVSEQYAEKAVAAGCVVIDNTSHFRYEKDIPLIIPEVNLHVLPQYKNRGIIANPNCSTIQMLVALKPIYDAVGIKRINVATYQSVSGTGQQAIAELQTQVADIAAGKIAEAKIYPHQIAFNVIPHIDSFQNNGYTREEMKMFWETQKIFEDKDILVNATAVRVPVFYGHSEAVNIETKEKITAQAVKELLRKAEHVILLDEPQQMKYPTAAINAAGNDAVYVGRVREDISHPHGINLWIVADNIRKGAALNAIQIAELLLRDYL